MGTVVAGKYRLERMLGRGGMGVVVAAEHLDLHTRVALKFLAQNYVQRADVVERFLREFRVCARLRSEHVCRVSEFGRLDCGAPFMVMEMLEGSDLEKVLSENGPLAVGTVADYLVQACDALAEAHAAQIVHRDLKPANLFLTRCHRGGALIKVLDFGVAKAAGNSDLEITHVNTVVGSASYMAPEQLRCARNADARSDIWSLGVILYELVSGRVPFAGETAAEVALSIMRESPAPLLDVPPGFAMTVERCLEKAPERRFQRIVDLVAALLPFVSRPCAAGSVALQEPIGPATEVQTTRMAPLALPAARIDAPTVRMAPLAPPAVRVDAPTVRMTPLARPAVRVDAPTVRMAPLARPAVRVDAPTVRMAPLARIDAPTVRMAAVAPSAVRRDVVAAQIAPELAWPGPAADARSTVDARTSAVARPDAVARPAVAPVVARRAPTGVRTPALRGPTRIRFVAPSPAWRSWRRVLFVCAVGAAVIAMVLGLCMCGPTPC